MALPFTCPCGYTFDADLLGIYGCANCGGDAMSDELQSATAGSSVATTPGSGPENGRNTMDRFSYSAHRELRTTAEGNQARLRADAYARQAAAEIRAIKARKAAASRRRIGLLAGLALLDVALVANVVRIAAGVMA